MDSNRYLALWEKLTGICLPVLQRIFSWLMKGVERLARPLVSNGTLVCVLFLLWGIGVWREAEYEVETGIHARHMLLDVYLLCVLLKLLPERWCRMTKWAIYIMVYPVTFFEVFLMERFRIIYTPTSPRGHCPVGNPGSMCCSSDDSLFADNLLPMVENTGTEGRFFSSTGYCKTDSDSCSVGLCGMSACGLS